MAKKITIIGASMGGLIAAAELSNNGFNVTLIEKSKTVGGLYNNVDTPFGKQEVGMHVLYVTRRQFTYLSEIFGADNFNQLIDSQVDIGACANFGKVFFDSHYPNIVGHQLQGEIFTEVTNSYGQNKHARNATEELINRFGETAGVEVVTPILRKLWGVSSELLTPEAINCFFDLRRMIVCDKAEADSLKSDPWLDSVVGNPEQTKPAGVVYDGRIGLTFKKEHGDLFESVSNWAARQGVNLQFETEVSMDKGNLYLDGVLANEDCDACIVTLPMHSLALDVADQLDQLELSIYYFQLSERLHDQFPSYYILAHSSHLKSSRIVNYDGYNQEDMGEEPSVLSVEVVHKTGAAPLEKEIAFEVEQILPSLKVKESYRLPRSLKVCSPTINNSKLLDSIQAKIERQFGNCPVFFSGMRTDTGVFFSHHTIGIAHESALECKRRLS